MNLKEILDLHFTSHILEADKQSKLSGDNLEHEELTQEVFDECLLPLIRWLLTGSKAKPTLCGEINIQISPDFELLIWVESYDTLQIQMAVFNTTYLNDELLTNDVFKKKGNRGQLNFLLNRSLKSYIVIFNNSKDFLSNFTLLLSDLIDTYVDYDLIDYRYMVYLFDIVAQEYANLVYLGDSSSLVISENKYNECSLSSKSFKSTARIVETLRVIFSPNTVNLLHYLTTKCSKPYTLRILYDGFEYLEDAFCNTYSLTIDGKEVIEDLPIHFDKPLLVKPSNVTLKYL